LVVLDTKNKYVTHSHILEAKSRGINKENFCTSQRIWVQVQS